MYITFLSTISILQTGKLKLYGREKLKVMTEAPLLFLEEAQSESREGKKSENLHKRIHIHRAVYLFTTKHNEIDTVVASHCVSTLRFRLLCCWLAGWLGLMLLLCEIAHFYNLFIAGCRSCSTTYN